MSDEPAPYDFDRDVRADERSESSAMWRDLRLQRRDNRRDRRERTVRRLVYLRDEGKIHFACLEERTGHYRLWNEDRSKRADFWPSTGSAQLYGSNKRVHGLNALLREFGVVVDTSPKPRPPHTRP